MRFTNLVLTFAILPIFFGCNQSANVNTIIVGTSADNPPYEYILDENIVGFDIDLINEIAIKLNKKILVKNMEFSALVPALKSGHIDLFISAISSTSDRRNHVDFSDVYASSMVSALTLKSKNINNINDLKGKKIGVQLGTTWEVIAKDIAKTIPNMEIHSINNNLVLLEELKKNNIDAIILEDLQVKKFEQLDSDFVGFNLDNFDSKYAIVFNKDSDLREKVNEIITTLKSTGKIHELKEKWLTPLVIKEDNSEVVVPKSDKKLEQPINSSIDSTILEQQNNHLQSESIDNENTKAVEPHSNETSTIVK